MKLYLGVDAGSISVNFVLTDTDGELVFQSYLRSTGGPVAAIQQGITDLKKLLGDRTDMEIAGVCTTGSGRELAAVLLGADLVKNEISTHARAAIRLEPSVRTVIEIGGQDSKVIIIEDGVVVDFAMNLVCAAGTGSFLDSQARRLGFSIEEFGALAMESQTPASIAGRCTVFAESDMIHKQQTGFPQEDIIMGLCMALARNYTGNVCRGKELKAPFLFQGGVSANPAIKKAFETVLNAPVLIPRYNMVMGAYGAALFAARENPEKTKFRGLDTGSIKVETKCFYCNDCSNRCEIIALIEDGKTLGYNGDRCQKRHRRFSSGRHRRFSSGLH